ncbi:hypothetical protein [Ornithinimicrobium cavernae]|uniref:hypothetical protein n=1 Tax=Ornithinimicrobium cavernae TaxID=2666047 RepID=UPI000D69BF8B|nr:hypothetical protein [Ornithinimicrobium cavernae]
MIREAGPTDLRDVLELLGGQALVLVDEPEVAERAAAVPQRRADPRHRAALRVRRQPEDVLVAVLELLQHPRHDVGVRAQVQDRLHPGLVDGTVVRSVHQEPHRRVVDGHGPLDPDGQRLREFVQFGQHHVILTPASSRVASRVP